MLDSGNAAIGANKRTFTGHRVIVLHIETLHYAYNILYIETWLPLMTTFTLTVGGHHIMKSSGPDHTVNNCFI